MKTCFKGTTLLLLLIAISLGSLSRVAYAETTLYPIADSYVEEGSPNSNFGGQSFLMVSDSTSAFVGARLAYITFDLSQIPAGSSVTSAVLSITMIYVSETQSIGVHYCSDVSWNELGITWNNKPNFNAAATDVQLVAFTIMYNYTVTNDVQTALSLGKLTEVFKCEEKHAMAHVSFFSKDQGSSLMMTFGPKLVVSYITTPTPTLTPTPTPTPSPTPSPTPPPSGCLIATATYGSELTPEVAYMRHVRDGLVGSSKSGKILVDAWNAFYYAWSPSVARFIAGSPAMQATFKALLLPLVGIVHVAAWSFNAIAPFSVDAASIVAFFISAVTSILVYLIAPLEVSFAILNKLRRRLLHNLSLSNHP